MCPKINFLLIFMHIKVPHYTFLKSAENYFIIDSMMQKKSISQISETYALLGWEKNFKFQIQ